MIVTVDKQTMFAFQDNVVDEYVPLAPLATRWTAPGESETIQVDNKVCIH